MIAQGLLSRTVDACIGALQLAHRYMECLGEHREARIVQVPLIRNPAIRSFPQRIEWMADTYVFSRGVVAPGRGGWGAFGVCGAHHVIDLRLIGELLAGRESVAHSCH